MSLNDLLSDMLARVRNGQMAFHAVVSAPASKFCESVLDVLVREGYIRGFEREQNDKGLPVLKIELKYSDGEPVIKEIKRVSRPGLRKYSSIKKLPKVHNGLGISILSTPKGVMSDHEARLANQGGEVLCTVF